MQNVCRAVSRLSSAGLVPGTRAARFLRETEIPILENSIVYQVTGARFFSDESDGSHNGSKGKDGWDNAVGESFGGIGSDDLGWDSIPTWSTGLAKDHFDGGVVGQRTTSTSLAYTRCSSVSSEVSDLEDIDSEIKKLDVENRKSRAFVDGWDKRMEETALLLEQVIEPGVRGSYLKDSEKAEMYRLHKENPEVYTVERLAKDYRIMRQRVHAILWLKQDEEEMEKKLGHPLDDSVELLLDTCPEFFASHDREFHVASLPYKPDFKVMPEGWDGITRDPDEVHYEISKKEDDMLYEEFLHRFNFNKMKMAGEVKCHKHTRRQPSDGWEFTVEKMGPQGKRGDGGGFKFVSKPDGSTRPLNEKEKMFLRHEKHRRRQKWWWREV